MSRRSRRNGSRAVGLALVAIALVLLGSASSAGADATGATLAAKGWWSELPVAPPNAAKGQLVVQGNPADPHGTAYAAVRYTLDGAHRVESLTLKVGTGGDQGGAAAVLLACQTGSAWSPADAGAWSAAPKVSSTCINGQRASDGTSWSFAIGSLQTAAVLDVAIVPGVDPVTKQTSTFQLVFDAPANGSLTTTAGSPPPLSAGAGDLGSGAAEPSGFSAGATASSSGSGSTGTFRPPPPVTPVATGLPPDKVGQTATAPAKQAATAPGLNTALTASPAKDRNKTAGYIVLALAAALGLYAYRQDNLMARNGGSLPGAPEEVAGLGRFAKPRQGQPPALT